MKRGFEHLPGFAFCSKCFGAGNPIALMDATKLRGTSVCFDISVAVSRQSALGQLLTFLRFGPI
jgi:hypothetical protein